MTSLRSTDLQPLATAQRLQRLDVVRGFALLGILLMNIEAFVGPPLAAGTGLDPALTGLDRWADALVYVLVQGKFYTLFSLLFGMGFAVMSQRAEFASRPFAGLYVRRALVLMGFGLLHAVLVWSGDILFLYGLMSLLLMAFRHFHGRWLVGLGVLAYLMGLGWVLLFGAIDALMQLSPASAKAWNEVLAGQGKMVAEIIQGQVQAYGHGSYADATLQRLHDFSFNLSNLLVVGPMVFGIFLLGKWFVESGAIVRPEQHARLFLRLRWVALPLGLGLMLASFALQPTASLERMELRGAFAFALGGAANLLMCLGYLAWLVRALETGRGQRVLGVLAPAGRMALSNYLLQSLVCTLVFYGYGMGAFGQLSRSGQVLFALGLFGLQVLTSWAWLARFRFGPMEWLWRSLTYLRWQPMRGAAV